MGGRDRYFYPTMYNMVRVVNRLAEMVEKKGGKVERREEELSIHFRDGQNNVRDDIPAVTTNFVSLIADLWIRFELNGYRYYFEVDNNPFFPDGYIKTPVGWDGKSYIDKIESGEKSWLYDDMFRFAAKEEVIDLSAAALLNQLEAAQNSCKFT